jgi:hypothetical protein
VRSWGMSRAEDRGTFAALLCSGMWLAQLGLEHKK